MSICYWIDYVSNYSSRFWNIEELIALDFICSFPGHLFSSCHSRRGLVFHSCGNCRGQVPGSWYQVAGIWCQPPGTRHASKTPQTMTLANLYAFGCDFQQIRGASFRQLPAVFLVRVWFSTKLIHKPAMTAIWKGHGGHGGEDGSRDSWIHSFILVSANFPDKNNT